MDEFLRRTLGYFFFFIAPAAVITYSAWVGTIIGMLGGMLWLGVWILFALPPSAVQAP